MALGMAAVCVTASPAPKVQTDRIIVQTEAGFVKQLLRGLEQSGDLSNWSPASTVTLSTNGMVEVGIDPASSARVCYRARSL